MGAIVTHLQEFVMCKSTASTSLESTLKKFVVCSSSHAFKVFVRMELVLAFVFPQHSYFLALFGDKCNVLGPKCPTFRRIVRIGI